MITRKVSDVERGRGRGLWMRSVSGGLEVTGCER